MLRNGFAILTCYCNFHNYLLFRCLTARITGAKKRSTACVRVDFIRVGNLMNSEIIGKPSQMPWAFVFTRIDQVPRHPAQLYEAIFYFFVALVLFFVWKSGKTEKYQGFFSGPWLNPYIHTTIHR